MAGRMASIHIDRFGRLVRARKEQGGISDTQAMECKQHKQEEDGPSTEANHSRLTRSAARRARPIQEKSPLLGPFSDLQLVSVKPRQ